MYSFLCCSKEIKMESFLNYKKLCVFSQLVTYLTFVLFFLYIGDNSAYIEFVDASSIRNLSDSIFNLREGELKEVQLFNLEFEKFVKVLSSEIKLVPFGDQNFAITGVDGNELRRAISAMKESILDLKKDLKNRNAFNLEEFRFLDLIADALDAFSSQVNRTVVVNVNENEPDSNENSDTIEYANTIENADIDLRENSDDSNFNVGFLNAFTQLKNAFLSAGASPFWKKLGLFDIGNTLPQLDNGIVTNVLFKNLSSIVNNNNEESTISFSNLFGGVDNVFLQKKEILNMLLNRTDALHMLFNETDLLNMFREEDIAESASKPSLRTVFNPKSNLLNLSFADNENSLFNSLNAFLKPSLPNFFYESTSMNDTNSASAAPLQIIDTFGLGNALKTLKEDLQSGGNASLVHNDLESLLGIVRHLNNSFLSLGFQTFSVDSIPSMFSEYMHDIMSVMKNFSSVLELNEELPNEVEGEVKEVISRGNELVEVLPFKIDTLAELPYFKDAIGIKREKVEALANFDESLLKKVLCWQTLTNHSLLQDNNFGFDTFSANRSLKLFDIPDFFNDNSALFEKLKAMECTGEHFIDAKMLFKQLSLKKIHFLKDLIVDPFISTSLSEVSQDINDESVAIEPDIDAPVEFAAREGSNFLNLTRVFKMFNDPTNLDAFMQKFNMLSILGVPGNFSFGFGDSLLNPFQDAFNFDDSKSDFNMHPVVLLFLQEIKENFKNSLQSILKPDLLVTNEHLTNAISSTKRLINIMNSVKSVTPFSSRCHTKKVDTGLNSINDVLLILSRNITVGYKVLPDLAAGIQENMMNVLNTTQPSTLFQLPTSQLGVAASSFMDSLSALKESFTHRFSKKEHHFGNVAGVLESVARLAISKGLFFLNAMKVFMTTLIFLFVEAPISIKLFLLEILIKSMEMPFSLGICREIFSNLPFGSDFKKLPAFEEAAVEARNFLKHLTTNFFSERENAEGEVVQLSLNSNLNILLNMPFFDFFNKSFNEKEVSDLMYIGNFKDSFAEVTNNTIKYIEKTTTAVMKVNKALLDKNDDHGTLSEFSFLPFSTSFLKLSDIQDILGINSNLLFSNWDLPSFQLPKIERNFANFQNMPHLSAFYTQIPDSFRQNLPSITSLRDSMNELQRHALVNSAFGGVGDSASSFLGDTINKLGGQNVFKGFK